MDDAGGWDIAPEDARIQSIMKEANRSGLIGGKDARISARVSADLIRRAKANTGINSDTKLVEYALAGLALEDNFAKNFAKLRGTVDPDIDLEF